MWSPSDSGARRRRGRPRGGNGGSREKIIEAAVQEFSQLGYSGATVRGIAARADIDAALVHHYFGSKADLFASIVSAPIRPDRDAPNLLDGPRDETGSRIVRHVLTTWERPGTNERSVLLLRAALGDSKTTPMIASFLQVELLEPVAQALGVEDAALRVSLVSSQIIGLLFGRYVLELPALAEASIDELVARVGPTTQQYLTGEFDTHDL